MAVLVHIDYRRLHNEAEHHVRVAHLPDKQVIVLLDIGSQHASQPLGLTHSFLKLGHFGTLFHFFQWLRIAPLDDLLLVFRCWGAQLVAILEFGGDHQHDGLGAGRDFNNVRLNLELNWALSLLLVGVSGKPWAVVEEGV